MPPDMILAIPIGIAIGVALGLLGAGGGVLTVPAVAYLLGQPVPIAVTTSLALTSANAITGGAIAWRDRLVEARIAGFFLVGAIPATIVGSIVSHRVPDEAILAVLGSLMLVAALAQVRRPYIPPESNRSAKICLPLGVAIGFFTGLAGIGGGFMVVPALVLIVGLATRAAIATSLAVIAISSLTGLAGHLIQAPDLPWGLVAVLVVAGAVGTVLGARLNRRVSNAALDRLFAAMLVALGAAILYSVIG